MKVEEVVKKLKGVERKKGLVSDLLLASLVFAHTADGTTEKITSVHVTREVKFLLTSVLLLLMVQLLMVMKRKNKIKKVRNHQVIINDNPPKNSPLSPI